MRARRDVYQAIADPTRRAIIQLVAVEPLDIKTLTGKFEMSQQAVSLHVKVLVDCGLVRMEQQGRNRFCQAQLGKIKEVADWVGQYRKSWDFKLDKMDIYLGKLKKERHGQKTTRSGRVLREARLLDAPVDVVWKVWTQPEQLMQWWGPDNSTTTVTRMEVRPGGKFDVVMRGPKMEIDSMSEFLAVERHRKIVYRHLTTPKFTTTIDFDALGKQTFLTWSVAFEMDDQFTAATEKYGAKEFLKQAVERLGKYAAAMRRVR
jgi:uncharacterized protein YndB with AHSA1/START domain